MGIIGYRTKYPKKGRLKKGRFRPLFGSMNLKTHLKKILNKDHSDNEKKGPYQNSYFDTAPVS